MVIFQNHGEGDNFHYKNQMLNLNNGFYLKISKDGVLNEIGPNFANSMREMKVGDKVSEHLIFQNLKILIRYLF